MDPQHFECFKLAFKYVQAHRFARIKQAVSDLHLVGEDGNLNGEFRQMLLSVYRAVRQGYDVVKESEESVRAKS